MTKIKGDSIRFYKDSTVLGLEIEIKLIANYDLIETTDKAKLWKSFSNGYKTWEVSGSAYIDFTNNYNLSQIFSDFNAGDQITVSVGYDSNFYTGGGILTKFDLKAQKNNVSKFAFNVVGNSILSSITYFKYGNTEIGTTERASAFSSIWSFTPNNNGQIQKAYFWGRGTTTSANRLICGIYDDVAGEPTNLVGRTTNPQPLTNTNEWQSVTFETPVTIISGNKYWFAFDDTGGGLLYFYQIADTGGEWKTSNFDQTYPDPITTFTSFSWTVSAYVYGVNT